MTDCNSWTVQTSNTKISTIKNPTIFECNHHYISKHHLSVYPKPYFVFFSSYRITMAITPKLFFLLLLQLIFVSTSLSNIARANELAVGFYKNCCPGVEYIVAKTVAQYVKKQPAIAASLLRIHFHDCFVRVYK